MGGMFLCTKHVLPHMEAQRSGHVVNTMGGGLSTYGVSKSAIPAFTRLVAEEEKDFNICVVTINPGTQIATEDAPAEARARMPGPEFVGNRFVLAAQAPMERSGQWLTLEDGKLIRPQDRARVGEPFRLRAQPMPLRTPLFWNAGTIAAMLTLTAWAWIVLPGDSSLQRTGA